MSTQKKHLSFYFLLALIVLTNLLSCKKNNTANSAISPTSSEKTISSFMFKAADNGSSLLTDMNGIVDADTIRVTLDQGTNLTLVPAIIFTGKSLSPAGGVAENFTTPVHYIVTAEDGSTKNYTVKITLIKVNAKIYVGSDDGNLYSLDARSGTMLWKYTTGGAVQSCPSLVNNIVYTGSNDGYLYAVDAATGTLKWKYFCGSPVENPVVSNGVVFVSCATNNTGAIFAIDATIGVLKWSKSSTLIMYSPTVYGGNVFVCLFTTGINAYDELSGSLKWGSTASQITKLNPAVSNGKVYEGGENGVFCFDAATGTQLWTAPGLPGYSAPTIDNNTVYIGATTVSDNFLQALDANSGSLKWRSAAIFPGSNPAMYYSPVVMNGIVYAANANGVLYAFNTNDGSLTWSGKSTGNITAANGVVYTGNSDKSFYALDGSTGAIKWKFTTGGSVYSGPCIVDTQGNAFHSGSSGAQN